ncbi:hypothetical protein BABINDRAFT_159115 [Babjeviella inositovora NRRL Y-12698]|uniref:Uncharacterized protein n=1 Tax=Babjeviella inositovora NRRL Y-12698 TaxID=984486 RepID=A0A1E3QY55_9ASCO|nr:uncharacterized protein BABINDRAFT_159115 [Babjeviella inositovora NRRL Y-12698]ODQ82551.1 hypothetical protein BABINDRAFT_159115 [Babjeviella inositovora NRRL Y-12698]
MHGLMRQLYYSEFKVRFSVPGWLPSEVYLYKDDALSPRIFYTQTPYLTCILLSYQYHQPKSLHRIILLSETTISSKLVKFYLYAMGFRFLVRKKKNDTSKPDGKQIDLTSKSTAVLSTNHPSSKDKQSTHKVVSSEMSSTRKAVSSAVPLPSGSAHPYASLLTSSHDTAPTVRVQHGSPQVPSLTGLATSVRMTSDGSYTNTPLLQLPEPELLDNEDPCPVVPQSPKETYPFPFKVVRVSPSTQKSYCSVQDSRHSQTFSSRSSISSASTVSLYDKYSAGSPAPFCTHKHRQMNSSEESETNALNHEITFKVTPQRKPPSTNQKTTCLQNLQITIPSKESYQFPEKTYPKYLMDDTVDTIDTIELDRSFLRTPDTSSARVYQTETNHFHIVTRPREAKRGSNLSLLTDGKPTTDLTPTEKFERIRSLYYHQKFLSQADKIQCNVRPTRKVVRILKSETSLHFSKLVGPSSPRYDNFASSESLVV